MATLITDPELEQELLARRQAIGADRYDEVWEKVYVMAPMANNEHQRLVTDLATVLNIIVGFSSTGQVFAGINLSDRKENWRQNYRCPDIAVFLAETKAENCGAFWYGGPDLAIEVVSPADRTRKKLTFYGQIGTRELLIIDRDPWSLTLFHLQQNQLTQSGTSTTADPQILSSCVIPLKWQLLVNSEDGRRTIKVSHFDGEQEWNLRGMD